MMRKGRYGGESEGTRKLGGAHMASSSSPAHTSPPQLRLRSGLGKAARPGHRHQLLNLLIERIALGDDLIDDAEGSGILGRQEIVAVEGLFDRGVVLAGVADVDLVQAPLHLD